MSGPAGGVIGGASEGAMAGEVKIMNPRDTYVSGHPVLTPMIDLVTIGAGDGSVACIDEAGAFHVGPRSAGSEPGPACYGRGGTEPTVTDAQIVLGRLDPDMALAIRSNSVARGVDPRGFSIMPFGGAGPCTAWRWPGRCPARM